MTFHFQLNWSKWAWNTRGRHTSFTRYSLHNRKIPDYARYARFSRRAWISRHSTNRTPSLLDTRSNLKHVISETLLRHGTLKVIQQRLAHKLLTLRAQQQIQQDTSTARISRDSAFTCNKWHQKLPMRCTVQNICHAILCVKPLATYNLQCRVSFSTTIDILNGRVKKNYESVHVPLKVASAAECMEPRFSNAITRAMKSLGSAPEWGRISSRIMRNSCP